MARPREYDDELRGRLLETAGRLLAEEGPHSLSTRRIAAEVGTSTSAIYSLIGSKEELLREMYLEGFRRLETHLADAPVPTDPVARLHELGRAYLENALDNPALYLVMFTRPIAEFCPTEDDVAYTLTTLQTLIDAVQVCVEAGIFHGDAEQLAVELWAVGHGVASLAAAGMVEPDRARVLYEHASAATAIGFMTHATVLDDQPSAQKRRKPSARSAINVMEGRPV